LRFIILTLFPGMFTGFINESIIGRARDTGLITVDLVNIRDFARDRRQVADDYPFGGGAGMVMKPEPVAEAIESTYRAGERPYVVLTSAQGRVFDQSVAQEYARHESIAVVCGHYEGVDERVSAFVDDQICIGDYILTGGEIAALAVLDATSRLVPGVISEESSKNESFQAGILEGPQYTRPREFRGLEVPEVLLSGDHEKVRVWRRKEALRRTLVSRPDLLWRAALTAEDMKLLKEIKGRP